MRNVEGKIITRSGTRFARDVNIDNFLSDKDRDVLYERWSDGVEKYDWVPVMEFRGGEKAISCEMVINTPKAELIKVYTATRALRLIDAASKHTQLR